MPRTLNSTFLASILAPQAGSFPVVLAAVSHSSFGATRRFNSDNCNYTYGGQTYLGVSLGISILTDDDRPPRGTISMVNVNQIIGTEMLAISTPASLSLTIVNSANFSYNSSTQVRTEIGTAPVLYQATSLLLRRVRGDALFVQADIEAIDVVSQPWPYITANQARTPGLFR